MKKVRVSAVCLLFLFLGACKTTNELATIPEVIIDEQMLDTLVVTAPAQDPVPQTIDLYRSSATRTHDLIHTKLEVSFDWLKQHVLGQAELTLSPLFYETNELTLDAKGFDIHSIKLNGKPLQYDYDSAKLKIYLDKIYTRDDKFVVNINYTAKPNEGPSSGSQAIASDLSLIHI